MASAGADGAGAGRLSRRTGRSMVTLVPCPSALSIRMRPRVPVDGLLDQRQAEARARRGVLLGVGGAKELLEEPALFPRRDADAGVAHPDAHLARIAALETHPDVPAGGRVLDCVRDQVLHQSP